MCAFCFLFLYTLDQPKKLTNTSDVITNDPGRIGRQTAHPCSQVSSGTCLSNQLAATACFSVFVEKRTIYHGIHAVESFLIPHFVLFWSLFRFFVQFTVELVCLHTQATHELRIDAEVVDESDLRVDLRHYVADRPPVD